MGEELCHYKERLMQAFNLFDRDKSGKISTKELKRIIKQELSESETDAWSKMVESADKNGDGELDFIEFLEVMNKVNAGSGPSATM